MAPRVTMRAQMSVKLHEGISSCEPKVIKDTQTTNFQTNATKELVKLLYYTTPLYIFLPTVVIHSYLLVFKLLKKSATLGRMK